MDKLTTKRRTISIPGAVSLGTSCSTDPSCCEDLVTPGEYGCEEINIGTLPSTVIMTLSGASQNQQGSLSIYTLGNTPTACGVEYQEGQLEFIRAWPHGSFNLNYIGLIDGAEFDAACSVNPDCDYHVYAYSKAPILAGQISSGGPPVRLESSNPLECCGTCPHIFFNEELETYGPEIAFGVYPYSLCAAFVDDLAMPCDIKALTIDCGGVDTEWLAQDLIDECIGDACVPPAIPIINADVYAGLYCDVGTSKIAQYPFRVTFKVYRQAIFWFPQSLSEPETCCVDGKAILQTYVVRRRWYNDGIAIIQAEPTVYTYSTGPVDMVFAGNGSIDAESDSPAVPGCATNACVAALSGIVIEINA